MDFATPCGVDALRGRLSKLLYNHLKKELPGLRGELDSIMVSTIKELELMGQTRATIQDLRLFLMKICVDAHAIMDAAVLGTYNIAADFLFAPIVNLFTVLSTNFPPLDVWPNYFAGLESRFSSNCPEAGCLRGQFL